MLQPNKASGIITLDGLSSDDPFGFEPTNNLDDGGTGEPITPFLDLDDDDDLKKAIG